MKKCQHIGCPNPQNPNDPLQIGLCTHHYHQLRHPPPPTKPTRQHPTHQAQQLLKDLAEPGDSLRTLAQKTGLTKDTIHHIQRGTWKHLRSKSWEQLQEAWAKHQHQQNKDHQ